MFELNIITPEKKLYNGKVKSLKVEALNGYVQILTKHAPLICCTKPCVTELVDENGEVKKLFTSDGILDVKENTTTFFVNVGEWPEEIDKERAETSLKKAQDRINSKENVDIIRAQSALLRALTRIKIIDTLK